jgi:hypothetical protein
MRVGIDIKKGALPDSSPIDQYLSETAKQCSNKISGLYCDAKPWHERHNMYKFRANSD